MRNSIKWRIRRRIRQWRYSERRTCPVCRFSTRVSVSMPSWSCRWCFRRLNRFGGGGVWWTYTTATGLGGHRADPWVTSSSAASWTP